MLITKFNKLIRNRWLWGAFAVLISVVFVGAFSQTGGCEEPQASAAGILYGEKVPRNEFLLARFFEMRMQDRGALSPEENELARNRAWRRVAALRTARQMGISPTDDEVGAMITRDPAFAVKGVFSKERYESVVNNRLRMGLEMFEEYIRQEITLQKMLRLLESVVLASPFEIDGRLGNITDSMVVEYVTLKSSNYVETVDAADLDVEGYFNANEALFRIPAEMNVKYAAFPITNYLANVTVTDNDIQDYYDGHVEDYSSTDTNGITVPVSLEEVREEILSKVRLANATFMAKDEATELVMALAPDRYGKAPGFEQACTDCGLRLATSAFFAAQADVPGLDVGHEFNTAAFNLDPSDPERCFSDAIVGESSVYVIAVNQKRESRIPELGEVREDVIPLVKRETEHSAFLKKAGEMGETLRDDMLSEKSFTESAGLLNLNVTTTETFTVFDGFTNEFAYSEILLADVVQAEQGEITDPLEIEDGAILACVVNRQPGDPGAMQLLRPQLLSMMDRYRSAMLYETWTEHLLVKAGFQDLYLAAEKDDDDQEEGESGD